MNKLGSCDVIVFLRHQVLDFKGRRILHRIVEAAVQL